MAQGRRPRRRSQGWILLGLGMVMGWGGSCGDDEADRGPRVVALENHAPSLVPQSDTTTTLGDTLYLRASATDQDGDTLVYGLVVEQTLREIEEGYLVKPSIDGGTGTFWFWPQARDRPARSFRFTAEDPLGAADTTRFTVEVP